MPTEVQGQEMEPIPKRIDTESIQASSDTLGEKFDVFVEELLRTRTVVSSADMTVKERSVMETVAGGYYKIPNRMYDRSRPSSRVKFSWFCVKSEVTQVSPDKPSRTPTRSGAVDQQTSTFIPWVLVLKILSESIDRLCTASTIMLVCKRALLASQEVLSFWEPFLRRLSVRASNTFPFYLVNPGIYYNIPQLVLSKVPVSQRLGIIPEMWGCGTDVMYTPTDGYPFYYEGRWWACGPDGPGVCYFSTGDVYKGEVRNRDFCGRSTGPVNQMLFEGKGVFFFANGDTIQCDHWSSSQILLQNCSFFNAQIGAYLQVFQNPVESKVQLSDGLSYDDCNVQMAGQTVVASFDGKEVFTMSCASPFFEIKGL